MKTKTANLTGLSLGYGCRLAELKSNPTLNWQQLPVPFVPFKSWAQGGPIIEREGIEVVRGNNLYFPKGNEKGDHYESLWLARLPLMDLEHGYTLHGPTPLIAAMRCFVASKLGDEIDVPDELT